MSKTFAVIITVLSVGCVSFVVGRSQNFGVGQGGPYFVAVGEQGFNCTRACAGAGGQCDMFGFLVGMNKHERKEIFNDLGINCLFDPRHWWEDFMPAVVINQGDRNYGRCLGWRTNLASYSCDSSHYAVRRLCRCSLRCNTRQRNKYSFLGQHGRNLDVSSSSEGNQDAHSGFSHNDPTLNIAPAHGQIDYPLR